MKRPELPEIVHVVITVDDGWDWHDNPAWHHEEHKIPYEYLVCDGDRRYNPFRLTHSETKRRKLIKDGWLSESVLDNIEAIEVVEYKILQEIESLKKKMDRYNFHPTL